MLVLEDDTLLCAECEEDRGGDLAILPPHLQVHCAIETDRPCDSCGERDLPADYLTPSYPPATLDTMNAYKTDREAEAEEATTRQSAECEAEEAHRLRRRRIEKIAMFPFRYGSGALSVRESERFRFLFFHPYGADLMACAETNS